jgi:threonine dehydrogenase-like Zn-dependent dehydrogenase
MRALLVDLGLARAGWTAVAGRWRPGAPWGRGGVLRLVEVPVPALPAGPGWALVRPTLAGVCGSDLKLLRVTGMSPLLTAYNPNRRAVPGHELTGVVQAVSPGTSAVAEGDPVLVEPTVRCLHKGLPDCRRCQAGEGHLCENLDRAGELCAGQGIGFAERVGGGWSESVLAHESMLLPADGLAPERAVLAEPAAVALHAALRWRRSGDSAVVIGPGAVGLLLVAALRRLHPDLDITAVCAGGFGAGHALAAGASRAVQQPAERVITEVAAVTGARALRPRIGRLPVLDGGADAVFDCVASAATVDLGLRLLRAGGTYVMVGTAARQAVDWSPVWWRELSVLGTIVYGQEPALGGRRTFEAVAEWLADPAYPVDGLVTHQFPLERYAEALETAVAGPAAGAVKVTLAP